MQRGVVVNFLDFKLANPYPDHFSYTLRNTRLPARPSCWRARLRRACA